MKKIIVVAVVILLGLGLTFYFLFNNYEDLPDGIAGVNGRLTVERIDVATLYAGRVEEVYVDEGDYVEKDQLLLRLSETQVEAQLAQAQAAYQQAMQGLKRAQAEIEAYKEQLEVAKLEYENGQKLRKDNLISSTELTRRQAQYKVAEASLTGAQAAQSEMEAAVAQALAKVDEVSDVHNDLLIKSPIKGRVEYRLVDVASVVGAGGKVISLLNLDDVYIYIFLPSHQSNQVKIGDEARVVVDGVRGAFPAEVVYVASDAQFTPKSVETEEERTKLMFKVKLKISQDVVQENQGLFKGGMTAMGYVKYKSDAKWPEALR